MKGERKVITHLNQALKQEPTGVNQYFLHARMYRTWGFNKLGEHEYHEFNDEMKHADKLSERIRFLEGLPNLQDLGKLLVGENPHDCIACDLPLERTAREAYQEAIAYCESCGDFVSRELLDGIMVKTEEHIDWLETQLNLIDRVGPQNYLQSQM